MFNWLNIISDAYCETRIKIIVVLSDWFYLGTLGIGLLQLVHDLINRRGAGVLSPTPTDVQGVPKIIKILANR